MEDQHTPLLSICIPTCNRPLLIKRALNSILPLRKRIEIIITDNSLDDATEKIVYQYLKGFDVSWRYFRNIPQISSTENQNQCIRMAQGEFIHILHDDDYLLSESIKELILLLENTRDKVLMFGVKKVSLEERLIAEQKISKTTYFPPTVALVKVLSNSSFIHIPSLVIHRDVYQDIGLFNPSIKNADDFELFVRIFSTYGITYYSFSLAAYTIHDQSKTMEMFNEENLDQILDVFQSVIVKKQLPVKSINRAKSLFLHQFILAGTYRCIKKKNFKEAKRIFKLFEYNKMKNLHFFCEMASNSRSFFNVIEPC